MSVNSSPSSIALFLAAVVPLAASAQPAAVAPAATPDAQLPRTHAPPVLKKFVEPTYPEEGRRRGRGGTVTLRLRVSKSGDVTDATIVSGISPEFDEAALLASKRLKFVPGELAGEAVSTTVDFEYHFTPPGHTHTGIANVAPPAKEGANQAPIAVTGVEQVSVVESVESERPLTAASARTVRDRDLKLRPMTRPGDLFRVTPGLMIVQHAGGGKANQYLLRGFDADHGTDIALSFDGLPLNMVSHGHGQGYADSNFVIPELIERVDVSKGPYFAENGDFANAGTVELVTRDRGESFVSFGGGSFGTLRSVAIAAPAVGNHVKPLVAIEAMQTDGPFQNPERFKKYNLFGKLTFDLDDGSALSIAAGAYSGSWRASGQLPARAIRAGLVDFYGSLDPSEGGASSRENLYVTYRLRPSNHGEFRALAYVTRYDFDLYSNFTFLARNPANGDQIEQWDNRTIVGTRASYRWLQQWRGILFDSSIGGAARSDSILNGLAYTHERERLRRVVDADIAESSVGAFVKEEMQVTPWMRLVGGLRTDHFNFRVDDRLEDIATQGNATSGFRGATRTSPKASVVLSPHRTTDVFLNYGAGFHSNDARGVVRSTGAVTPLTKTLGYETGARTRLLDRRLELAASLWGLDIDSETVWVGDEGTTEASGATRRLGVEVEGRWEILPWLFADVDATVARAKFRENAGNANAVALAPRFTMAGGLSALHRSGLRGTLRGLYIAERPATEDDFLKAEATTLIDLFAAYRWRSFELSLSVENVIDRRYKAAQFATTTRLPGEPATGAPPPAGACPAGTRASTNDAGDLQGCQDVSFSPGNPFGFRVMGAYYF